MIDPRIDIDTINSYVYDDEWSRLWQIHFAHRPETDETVDRLADLAQGGDALELGVGSGRIAIPLTTRCRSVQGIDTSAGMLRELAAKPGGDRVRAHAADVTSFDLGDDRFDLIYFVSWGIHMLLSDGAKDQCFARASTHLRPGGCLVIEGMHPEGYPFRSGGLSTLKIDRGSTVLNGELHRPAENIVLNTLIFLTDNTLPRVHATASHYVPTARLDAMAAIHGLHLEAAYADWTLTPLTDSAPSMIRVYRKALS